MYKDVFSLFILGIKLHMLHHLKYPVSTKGQTTKSIQASKKYPIRFNQQ